MNHSRPQAKSVRVQFIPGDALDRGRRLLTVWLIAITLTLACQQFLCGQEQNNSGQPFIGFQSLDGTRVPLGNQATGRDSNVDNRSAYPYPATGNAGYATQSGNVMTRGQAPVRTSLGASINSSQSATGTLNRTAGHSATPITWGRSVVPATASTYRAQPQIASRAPQFAPRAAQPTPAAPNQTAATRPNMVRVASLNKNVVQQTASTIGKSRSNAMAETSGNLPANTSNATRVAKVPQNCCCPPQVGYNPAAANQAPSLNGAVPNYGYAGYQVQPGVGTPQFYAPSGNVLTPFFRGSGVYTPLLPLVQPNPRTYLGQGIIGQPTAYVDGQPLRNLLRYVSP